MDDKHAAAEFAGMTLAQLVETLVELDVMTSRLAAIKLQVVDMIRVASEMAADAAAKPTETSRDLAFRSARAEVACALRISERAAESMFGLGRVLIRSLPVTMGALGAGAITARHAQTIAEEASLLHGDNLQKFEQLIVPVAESTTPATLARRARSVRESLDPSSIEQRTRQAVEERTATWKPDRDGMGWLGLYLPVADGAAIYSRATDAARKLRAVESADGVANPRTLPQLRADVMRDALMCGTFSALGGKLVRPDVYVTVPVFSLMGLTQQPGSLDGYGPIDAGTARRLAANAPSFVRLLVHPETGIVLSVGKERYSPPSDLKTGVRVRHQTCAFFGCNQPAERCDIDHTQGFAFDGETRYDNLAPMCRGHHTIKGETDWNVEQAPDGSGTLTWTSPAGRTYVTVPESRAQVPEIPDLSELPEPPEVLQHPPDIPQP